MYCCIFVQALRTRSLPCRSQETQAQSRFYGMHFIHSRVVKSSQLLAKIAAYLVGIGRLFCLAFLYGWRFLNKIFLDWPLTLTTQPSTSKLSDNCDVVFMIRAIH